MVENVDYFDDYDLLDLSLLDFCNLTIVPQGVLASLVLRNLLHKLKAQDFVDRNLSILEQSVESLNDPAQIEGTLFIKDELEKFFNHQFSVSINTEDTETKFSLTSKELGSFYLSCNDVSDLIKFYNKGQKALVQHKKYLQEHYPMVYDPELYREHIIRENIFIGALILALAPALFPFLSTPALLGTIISLIALSLGSRIWQNQSAKKKIEDYKNYSTTIYGQIDSTLTLPLEAENLQQHPRILSEIAKEPPLSFSSTTTHPEARHERTKPGA